MEIVRAGVIGIGNMGSAHALKIFQKQVEGMQLTAVCDVRKERLAWAAEAFQERVHIFTDYRELLNSGLVDAVIIATPHLLHPVIAQAAMEKKLHVLTEKPAGVETAEVRKMNEAAQKSGVVFGIMYNQRTNPLYRALKEDIASGKLGEIKRFVWIINNWYRTQAYYDSGTWRATWNGEGGGALLNQCPHQLDLWQWITGMPVKVRAVCREGQYHQIQVEDDAMIYVEYANGANGCFITSTGEYPGTNRLEISGTRGKAVIEDGKLKRYLLECDEREICFQSEKAMPTEEVVYSELVQTEPESGHLGILQNFTDAILKGTPLLAPGLEGINGLLISNAAYLSSWTDEWVTIPFDEQKFSDLLAKKRSQETEQQRKKKQQETVEKEKNQVNTNEGGYEPRWSVRW